MLSLKEFFVNVDIEKKAEDKKKQEKLPVGKELITRISLYSFTTGNFVHNSLPTR